MILQASENMKNLILELIERKKAGSLSVQDIADLEKHLQLEHEVRLTKALSRRKLLQSQQNQTNSL